MLAAAGIASLVAMAVLTHAQVGRWRDSETLFLHTLGVTSGNYAIHTFWAGALLREGRLVEAREQYREALRIQPDFPKGHHLYGLALERAGKPELALDAYQEALRVQPDLARAHVQLGLLLAKTGEAEAALDHLRAALRVEPENAGAHFGTGLVHFERGELDLAREAFERAGLIPPAFGEQLYERAVAKMRAGSRAEAEADLRTLVHLEPGRPGPISALAWLLATSPDVAQRRPEEALLLAERAAELTDYRNPSALDTLAAAQASAGRFGDAISTASRALRQAEPTWSAEELHALSDRIGLYRAGRSFVEYDAGSENASPLTLPSSPPD